LVKEAKAKLEKQLREGKSFRNFVREFRITQKKPD